MSLKKRRLFDPYPSDSIPSWYPALMGCLIFGAIVIQLWNINAPYLLAYETGFQELIARRHLILGFSETHGLSTITHLGNDPVYHATHPPLLQWTLAGLFWFLGDSEAVARLIPLFSYIAILAGMLLLARSHLTSVGILLMMTAFIGIPLASYSGRVINFETPVLACIVWTMLLLERIRQKESRQLTFALLLISLLGTLLDWPYSLFVMCLFLLSLMQRREPTIYRKAVFRLWLCSMTTSVIYVAVVYELGGFDNLLHHAKVQSGAYHPSSGFQWPSVLTQIEWWRILLSRLSTYATPVSLVMAGIACILGLKNRFKNRILFWFMMMLVFSMIYLLIFSRASERHLWCLFYLTPALCFAFGYVGEHLRLSLRWLAVILLIAFSFPVLSSLRSTELYSTAVQIGHVIRQATEFLPEAHRSGLNGPLLYVNRVDPLPYYAQCETAFTHLSVNRSEPHQFLRIHQPEFVVLTGYGKQSSLSLNQTYPTEFFDELQQSYTLVYHHEKTELWESLASPYVSLMGELEAPTSSTLMSHLMNDGRSTHVGTIITSGENTLTLNLSRFEKTGNRWLYGWVMTQDQSSQQTRIHVRSEEGTDYGNISVHPQSILSQWQEFWLPIGQLPDSLLLSWDETSLILGDLRLVSETAWDQDLTHLLASEIKHRLEQPYQETITIHDEGHLTQATLQHPGFGINRVSIPPIRIAPKKALSIKYGLNPATSMQSDGLTFRLWIQNNAFGEELLFEDTLNPATQPDDHGWQTQSISLDRYARQVVTFIFEVDPGNGTMQNDHALWLNATFSDTEN